MKKQAFNWMLKALLAGLAAFALLCLLSAFYYNIPVHYLNPDGATEYKYEPGPFYRGTEGFGIGRVNNDGFNNLFDYTPGMPIDILLMGSSHSEGFCVPQQNSAGAVLSSLFEGEKTVYNIGMAAHTFLYCAKRLDRALTVYAPREYAVLELATLRYDPAAMDAAADGTLPDLPSHSGGILAMLQKLPFLRLMYTKYFKGTNEAVAAAAGTAEPVSDRDYEAALTRLLQKLGAVSRAHGVKLILAYTPTVTPDAEGKPVTDARPGERELFARLAAENGLLFLDLTARNSAAMTEEGTLLFGFPNTAPGQGHINSAGLRLYAEGIRDLIRAEEG